VTDPVIGIDPGLTGGVALVLGDALVDVWPMPVTILDGARIIDAAELARIVNDAGPVRMVVVERLHGLGPGIGKRSAWSLAWSAATIRTTLTLLERPVSTVSAADWRKAAAVRLPNGATARERKLASIARARELWPAERTWRASDDGLAEAALMAWGWGRG